MGSDFNLKKGIQGSGVFTQKTYHKGDIVLKMHGEILSTPTRTSIQVGPSAHIEDEIGGHINHNCDPNSKVDRDHASLVALKTIKKGEEITFDYNQNEDLLANPFACRCCGRLIEGKLAKISEPNSSNTPVTGHQPFRF